MLASGMTFAATLVRALAWPVIVLGKLGATLSGLLAILLPFFANIVTILAVGNPPDAPAPRAGSPINPSEE